ncbi:hypothetical protein T08_1199 [Trichinella sp. T8]|nr:hypothetical protein T08_1199 [Trichinella sp. T8]
MEKKERRQITTAQKLQIIQTVDENPNMKRIDIARMMKIPSSRSPDERTNGILLYFLMGWSRPVSRYSYCSLTALFYWAVKSLSYWFSLSNCSLIQIFPL